MPQQQPLSVALPGDVDFSMLELSRNPTTGGLEFHWAPIERICEASCVDVTLFRQHEDNVAELIVQWYVEHLKRGGSRNPVAQELIGEAIAEDALGGGGFSYPPGRG